PHDRRVRQEVVDRHVTDAEPDVPAVPGPGVGQVGEDVGLRVEPGGGAHEVPEVDAVAVPAEGQDDAVVALALAVHAVTDAAVGEEVDGALFQDAGAGRVLDLATGAQVDGDGLDPGAGQQMAEHKPGGTCPDHGDLRTAVDDRCGGGGRGEGPGPHCRARRPASATTSDTSRRTRLRRPGRPPSSSGGPGRQRVRPGGLMPRVTDGYAEALGARTARPALTG